MEQRRDLQRRLAYGLLTCQVYFLSRDGAPTGALCQIWLPKEMATGEVCLITKGMPFCVAGMGDLLACFRCISCRFNFSTNPAKPRDMGAPGRVYLSGQPELACNVQTYPKEEYPRRDDAEQCCIKSSMLLPVFCPTIKQSLGVLEVVQASDDMAFLPVARTIDLVLRKIGLATSLPEEVQAKIPTAATTSLGLLLRTGLLKPTDTSASGGGSTSGEEGEREPEERQRQQGAAAVNNGGADTPGDYATAKVRGGGYDAEMGGESDDENERGGGEDGGGDGGSPGPWSAYGGDGRSGGGPGGAGPIPGSAQGHQSTEDDRHGGGGRRRGRAGKPGLNLTLADIQGHFKFGLKDAATSLGMCTTTLKRACRRHGIYRWPSRALAKKLNAQEKGMQKRGSAHDAVVDPGAVPRSSMPPDQLQQMPSMELDHMGGLQGMDALAPGAWPGPAPWTVSPMAQQQQQMQSDMSLEGAVAMSAGGANNGNLTVASGMSQWGNGTAAGATAWKLDQQQQQQQAQQQQQQQQQAQQQQQQQQQDMTGGDPTAPVICLPSGSHSAVPPGPVAPLSQLSLPSLSPSVLQCFSGLTSNCGDDAGFSELRHP